MAENERLARPQMLSMNSNRMMENAAEMDDNDP